MAYPHVRESFDHSIIARITRVIAKQPKGGSASSDKSKDSPATVSNLDFSSPGRGVAQQLDAGAGSQSFLPAPGSFTTDDQSLQWALDGNDFDLLNSLAFPTSRDAGVSVDPALDLWHWALPGISNMENINNDQQQ